LTATFFLKVAQISPLPGSKWNVCIIDNRIVVALQLEHNTN